MHGIRKRNFMQITIVATSRWFMSTLTAPPRCTSLRVRVRVRVMVRVRVRIMVMVRVRGRRIRVRILG